MRISDWSSDVCSSDLKEAVEGLFTIGGFSFAGAGQNMCLAFVRLKDWSERETPEHGAAAVAGLAMAALSTIKDAMVFTVLPPSVPGLDRQSTRRHSSH